MNWVRVRASSATCDEAAMGRPETSRIFLIEFFCLSAVFVADRVQKKAGGGVVTEGSAETRMASTERQQQH